MESSPRMEARPPAVVESVVRLLVPPVAREHVLGDLSERYTSTTQYLVEAMRTLPFVVKGQIRRTSYFRMWPLVATMLMTGFGADRGPWSIRAVIPSLATLIGFMFRDAYRVPDLRYPWRQGLVDLLIVGATAAATEAVVALTRPEWLMSPKGVAGGTVVLAILYLLRVQNPARQTRLLESVHGSAMTLDQLRSEVKTYDDIMRRAIRIELVAGYVILPVFAIAAVRGHSLIRIGAGLTVAGIAFVIWYIHRGLGKTNALSTEGEFATVVTGYRARLEGHVRALRTMWLWYLLPLGIGPALMISAGVADAGRPPEAMIGSIGGFMLTWTWIAWAAGRRATSLERRRAALTDIQERR
jgi:hypothetical protein